MTGGYGSGSTSGVPSQLRSPKIAEDRQSGGAGGEGRAQAAAIQAGAMVYFCNMLLGLAAESYKLHVMKRRDWREAGCSRLLRRLVTSLGGCGCALPKASLSLSDANAMRGQLKERQASRADPDTYGMSTERTWLESRRKP